MRDHDLQSYITGFLAARDEASAHVILTPYGIQVSYLPNAERAPEYFVVRTDGALDNLPPAAIVHILDQRQPAPIGFAPLATCQLMARDLGDHPSPPTGFDVFEVTDLAVMAMLDHLPGFLPPSQDLRAVQFALRDGGRLVAAARSAMGLDQDVIADNLVDAPTAPDGAAEAVLALLLATAGGRGQTRALALVDAGQQPLFASFGFAPMAQVESYQRGAE